MSKTSHLRAPVVTSLLLALAVALPANAGNATTAVQTTRPDHIGIILPPSPPPAQNVVPPDSGLYTTYSFGDAGGYVLWLVCGSTVGSDGCYGSGNLGPFGHAGAIIEGNETVSGKTVTRNIYVVDDAANGGAGVKLYIYTKTDVVSSPYDQITVNLTGTLSLPLVGGAGAVSYIAANKGFLFTGTSRSQEAVRIEKDNLSITELGGFSPPINVSSITADKYGFVTVNFGGSSGFGGFYAFDPSGNFDEDGGGNDLVAGNANGISIGSLAANGASGISASRMQIRLKKTFVKP
ncbi:MAG: hypothetical protein ABI870_11435 [Rhodanobacter sp.]